MLAAAAADTAELSVFKRPILSILCCGDELRAPGSESKNPASIPDSISPGIAALARDWGAEALAIGRRAAYLWCAEGILKSSLAAAIEKTLRDGVTSRNWTTTQKLLALLDS